MGYNPERIKKCQLEILDELDRVCRINGFSYCLAYGSCLGAVRHQGFIPWDDDIDVYMPIEDFDKLSMCKDFMNPYFLQTAGTDAEYGLMISRLRDSNTTMIETEEKDRNMNHGVFVDIYPMFYAPRSNVLHYRLIALSLLYRLYLYDRPPRNKNSVIKHCSAILLKLTPRSVKKTLMDSCYKALRKSHDHDLVCTYYGAYVNTRISKRWIIPTQMVPFEDRMVPIPGHADKYLTLTYGDYMKLPPEEKRVIHHNYEMVDIDNSYTIYKNNDSLCEENLVNESTNSDK